MAGSPYPPASLKIHLICAALIHLRGASNTSIAVSNGHAMTLIARSRYSLGVHHHGLVRSISGGLVRGGRWAENVGAQVVSRDCSACSDFDVNSKPPAWPFVA